MVEQIGRYNVDYVGGSWDGDTEYTMVIISEFNRNEKEIDRRILYFLGDYPHFTSEGQVAALMTYPNHTKMRARKKETIEVERL